MPVTLDSNDGAQEIAAPGGAHWGFWGTLIWGAVILIVEFVMQTITLIAVVLWRKGDITKLSQSELSEAFSSISDSGFDLSVMTLVTTVLCGGIVFGVIKLKKRSLLRAYLSIEPVSLATMRNWLALLAGVLVIEDLLTIAFDRPFINEFMSVAYATANPIWMLWLAVVVAAPLFEEMFFRGFLLKGLAASFLGPIGAVAATSGLWAVLHLQYDLYDIANIFCLGLLLGTARLVTGSLFVPLMLHAITNLLATVEVALLR